MGFRIRKSINLGGGVKLNLGKKSVGVSVGGKAGRFSINSKGRTTTTIRTPIKGVSYSKSHTIGSGNSGNSGSSKNTFEKPETTMKTGSGMLLITIFLGYLGVHRFLSGQIGMGLLYLFTIGLFGIGWIHDIIIQVRCL